MSPRICPRCDGTRWVRSEPADRRSPVLPCHCEEERAVSGVSQLRGLGVTRRLAREASFESFEELTRDLGEARRRVERWAEAYPDVEEGLFLTGPSGVGKTHLAVAAVRRVLLQRHLNHRAQFVYMPELIERLRMIYRDDETSQNEILAPLFEADLLVLDDLGENMGQEWVVDKVLYILTRCYNDCAILLCTSVFELGGERGGASLAEKITDRGVSRLREACDFVEVQGEDYRDTVISHGVGLDAGP